MRYTAADVKYALESLVKACESVGIDAAGFQLQQGSQVNGRAWRLFSTRPGEGGGLWDTVFGAAAGGDRGYLGWTAREAASTLRAWTSGLYAARDAVREQAAPLVETACDSRIVSDAHVALSVQCAAQALRSTWKLS